MRQRSLFHKQLSRATLAQICEDARANGRIVGFTSGAFDLIHKGHVTYLEEARRLCDMLIVGVNSDLSVKRYKSRQRPIQNEQVRLTVVAALESVDFAFLLQESDTNCSVEMLRPDVYIKGGDYTVERLSSRRIVESYGGKVVLTSHIPMQSTTAIIDKIMQRVEPEVRTTSIDIDPYDSRPAVFLDRDGTINEHVDYLHQPERFRILPGALEAIREMREAGFRIVVITNQPGIGTGYFSKDDFFKVNKKLLEEASARGVAFDRIFFCPHSKGDNCNCRKPKPAMIERAIRELNIDRRGSFVIGDMTSDIEAARRAGIKSILVKTGRGGTDQLYDVVPDYIVSDLQSAAEIVTLNQYSRSVELLPAEI